MADPLNSRPRRQVEPDAERALRAMVDLSRELHELRLELRELRDTVKQLVGSAKATGIGSAVLGLVARMKGRG